MVKNEDMRQQGRFSRTVSRYVSGLLHEKGVKQRQLAARLGRSQAYVSVRWNGRDSWTLDELDCIAALVGFTSGLDLMAEIGERARRAEQTTRHLSAVADTLPSAALGHDVEGEIEDQQGEP